MASCNKKCLSKRKAQESLNRLLKFGKFKRGRIYPCDEPEHNGYWHITHKGPPMADMREKKVKLKQYSKWKFLIKKS